MKKSIFLTLAAATALMVIGCGPSAEEQEKAKQEVLQMEAAQRAVDSTKWEVERTSRELDSLLQLLKTK